MEKFKDIFLKNRDVKQTMFKNIFWLAASQASRFLRIITLLYAARVLGAAEYGLFSYTLGLMGIFLIFADMGINPILTRDALADTEKNKDHFASAFWIKIALASITALAFFIFAPLITKIEGTLYLLPLAALLIIFDTMRDFIVAYLRGLSLMEREALIAASLNLVLAVFGLSVLRTSPSALNFMAAYVVASGVGLAGAIFLVRKNFSTILGEFKRSTALEILRNAWPIALNGAFGLLMLNMDIFMLGLWQAPREIGLYAAGQKIMQVLYLVPALLASGIFPAINSIIKSGDREREKNLNEKSLAFVFLFTIPIVVGGIILSNPLLEFVFGADYTAGSSAFRIILLNTLFIFPGILLANIILSYNKQKTLIKYVAFAAFIDIALNYILIPQIGILGAALSTLLGQSLYFLAVAREIKKTNDFKLVPGLSKILISAGILAISAYLFQKLGLHVLLNIALSAALYFVLLAILRERTLSEIKTFVQVSLRGETSPEVI